MGKLILAIVGSLVATANCIAAQSITEELILKAQQDWAQGIVDIGRAKVEGKDYKALASAHIEKLYDYSHSEVLFKPTKASQDQFRETFDEAHSYFVKGKVSEDDGFAINPWSAVRFDNHNVVIHNDIAFAMGNYFFTANGTEEVKVEYTFGYRLDPSGELKIIVHHSSLPYSS